MIPDPDKKLVRVLLNHNEFAAALACYAYAKSGFKDRVYFNPGDIDYLLSFTNETGVPILAGVRVEMQLPKDQE